MNQKLVAAQPCSPPFPSSVMSLTILPLEMTLFSNLMGSASSGFLYTPKPVRTPYEESLSYFFRYS